ncbi:MAG: tRNA (adenosine(37)-N6)-threonylcarbamoyltransferase complex ATPase subunit type 1 TsaE, partial [Firmicutes bacterium]|nr:tRNA (adenosine(37)-N6)-threonylcarbamoyltransferase complex ATPase subunit type 1 TsaE [Bacillota bacterium]
DETGYTLKSRLRGKSLEITAIGKAAHAAIPQAGLNAISILMRFLGRIEDWNNEDVRDFITFYNTHIAMETDGRSMGCAVSDGIVGPLTFNVGLLKGDPKAARISVNCRCPVAFTDEDLYAAITPVAEKWDLGIVKESYKKALYVPKESEFIQTLMACYREFTGDNESQPMAMGGATYARTLPNAVAFGARFPGDPSLAHQANEYTLEESLMRAAHIYAEAIVRLAECEDPSAEQTVRLASLEDTERLGRLIAKNAKPGMVIALSGDLGAGKTTLTQSIAKELGVKEPVTSPTFTLIQEYKDGRLPLYHFDVYRLSSAEELEDIGAEEYFYGKGLSVVEWADRAGSLIPSDAVRISLAYGEKENERVATVRGMLVSGFESKKPKRK